MRSHQTKLWLLVAFVVAIAWAPSAARQATQAGTGPAMQSIGPLAFGPDGTLFAADNQGAAIFALDLGAQANGGAAGAKGLDALDEKLAAPARHRRARDRRSPISPCTRARATPTCR